MNKETSRRISRVFFWILVIIIFFYLMFPFYWAVVSALKSEAELIQTPATLWPQDPSLQNFRAVFQNQAFLRGLLNSTIVATSATVLSLLVGSFAGYALGKLRFSRQNVVALYYLGDDHVSADRHSCRSLSGHPLSQYADHAQPSVVVLCSLRSRLRPGC